ncbi:DinB family protein [Paenibacillus chitinolyticus]|uniref:DinB family protein n=1 Tax=Paenibacillus chitinolyticus TaxID=79263 RepID=UPI001C492237|nr:DinB family protein [Paenibacillus chitinolyticus]MBV6713253.1 DinB family protein [Paenibacillus chitinolyticus]
MNGLDLLKRGWEHAYGTEDWYAPLKDAVSGISADQASWRPPGEAGNTIWETVNHLVYYKQRLLEQLQGEEPDNWAKNNDDTFKTPDTHGSEEAWQRTLRELDAVHTRIGSLLGAKSDPDMDAVYRDSPIGFRIGSVIQHDAFHTGEIVLIRKLQGSWPATRRYE